MSACRSFGALPTVDGARCVAPVSVSAAVPGALVAAPVARDTAPVLATPGGGPAAASTPGGSPATTPGGNPAPVTPGGSDCTGAPSAPKPGFGAPGEGPVGTAMFKRRAIGNQASTIRDSGGSYAIERTPAPEPYSTGGGGVIPALNSAAANAATVMSGGTEVQTSYPPSA